MSNLPEDFASSASVHRTQGLYELLLGSCSLTPTILFCWWPRSEEWCWKELVQRSTQCLPAVRPGLDLVALPSVPEVQDLWDVWSKQHGLHDRQAIWFAPHLDAGAAKDPATLVCQEVLASFAGMRAAPWPTFPMANVHMYPAFATASLLAEASSKDLGVIDDLDDGPCPPLSQYPHISCARQCGSGCLSALLPPLRAQGVRFLKGYVASSPEDLREAFALLREECPEDSRFLLRRSQAFGTPEATVISSEEDLDAVADVSVDSPVVLEEAPPLVDQKSPGVIHMVGSEPCPWPINDMVPEHGVEAARVINQSLAFEGDWRLEFAMDSVGKLVVVGIRTGALCQSVPVQLWASRSVHPVALATAGCFVPAKSTASIKDVMALLDSHELEWDGDEGIIVYQCAPGSLMSFAIASSFGSGAVDIMRTRLFKIMLESFGLQLQ